MKSRQFHRGLGRVCLVSVVLLAAACDNDGNSGPAGPAGPGGGAGVPVTSTAESLSVSVTAVSLGNPSTVDFTVTNEQGTRYVGITSSQIRLTIAKLIPEANGEPSEWVSYINREEGPDVGPGTETVVQATTDAGTLTSNGDGTYRYTFTKDITNIATPAVVVYQPTLTHRIGMQIYNGQPVTNVVYDWRPSDGATTGLVQRDIAATGSCNECHHQLAIHGGSRREVEYCVICHNPGSIDANSTNTVDMKVMIHKIHRGKDLPSVVAGGEYAIWGNRDTKHDYSELSYPQDIRNCTKCHDAADAATPQADNWQTVPSIEACGSCHDDVNFVTGENHSSESIGGVENGECTACHSDNLTIGGVAQAHQIPALVRGANYKLNIISVTNTAPGQFPVVTYEITNPQAADARYNLLTDPRFTNSSASVSILLGWPSVEYTNVGNGSTTTPASPVTLNGKAASTGNNAAPTANGDGTFTVTSLRAVPASITGSGVASMTARAVEDFGDGGSTTDRVPIRSVVKYFAITDSTAVARREVVDIDQCNECHLQLSLHGNSRTDEVQNCVICHNADNTDLSRRGGTTGVDGKAEETIDMKYMIHAIHGAAFRTAPITVYGFGGSVNTFDTSVVHYPGILNNCSACHVSEASFEVPLRDEVLATTIDSNVVDDAGHADDVNITPTAAVCSSCHDNSTAITHMEQNGASFVMVGDPGTYNETCSVCHGSGRLADVAEVHAIAP